MLFKKIGLATLALGSVLSLVPATAFARDRDDRYESRSGRDFRELQRRERERLAQQRRNRSYNYGYGYRNPSYDYNYGYRSPNYNYNNGYNQGYSNGYYDRYGDWHSFANRLLIEKTNY